MKIALNIELMGARRGGAEKYAGTIARWLVEAGHEVHVFAREVDPGELPASVPCHAVRVQCPPACGWLRTYLFAKRSQEMLAELRFDLIIGFNKVWYVDAYMAVGGAQPASLHCNSRRFRTTFGRAAWWALKCLSPKQWVFRAIARRQFHGGYRPQVIAPSRMVARHFAEYHGVEPDRISVVYNALDSLATLNDHDAARLRFRDAHSLQTSDVAILFVGRNYALKGLGPLIESFARVVTDQPRARLIVCGSGRDRRFIRQAKRQGVADRVHFLGFVSDIRECFAGCDLFAFPTFYDPCSLVVLEAMNAGLPVITTKQNGAGELLTRGQDGFVIESPWALDELTDCLKRLVADDALRAQMSEAARRNVLACTIEARQRELLAALEHAACCNSRLATMRNAA